MKSTMPNDIVSEQALLGCCLIDNTAIDTVSEKLQASDFYRIEHQHIFNALTILRAQGEQADVFTVLDTVRSKTDSQISPDELRAYLVNIMNDIIFTDGSVEYYTRIVQRYSRKREQAKLATKIREMAQDDNYKPEDVTALIEQAGALVNADTGLTHISDLSFKHCATLEKRMDRDKQKLYTTGLPTLDREFGKFGESQLIVLKALRGTGKTHILVDWSMRCVNAGKTAVVYSLEMSSNQLLNRFLAYQTQTNSAIFRKPELEDMWTAISSGYSELSAMNLYFYDNSGVDIDVIRSQCRALKNKGSEIGFIGIDFAELVGAPKGMATREQELARIASGLRNLANEIDTTVLLLSQVNEQGQERNSRALGNLADLLISFRCESTSDVGMLQSEKNRFGHGFNVQVRIDKGTSRLTEIDFRHGEDNK